MAINPYQPPPEVEVAAIAPAPDRLEIAGRIRFSGAPTSSDLNRLLTKYDHVGVPTLAIAMLLIALVLLFVMIVGSLAGQLVVAGLCGIALVACLVSTKLYRRAMFRFVNPLWDAPVQGEISPDGITIKRDHGSFFLHWNCLETVVVHRNVVGLLTPNSIGQSMVISESMMDSDADLAGLILAAETVARKVVTAGSMARRRQNIAALLRDPDRQRSVQVPGNAIAFSGPVTMADLIQFGGDYQGKVWRRKRSTHGLIAMTLLVLFATLIAIGLATFAVNLIGTAGLIVLPLLFVIAVAWHLSWSQPRLRPDESLQHLLGFADDSGVTTDAFAVVTKLPWSHLRCTAKTDDRITLRHTHSRRVVALQRNMFSSDQEWTSMVNLVERKLSI
ncbi:hypothetical protein [Planctomycetes bacterium K23_9]|uniref:Uncharacterized protein n=1 Tax=Stieleria marina TaxID=1930275 RepID=A0A517NVC2_9BACT|nr:hypothetical protein K239x_30650 [Planctomycetes bacterium K23_9]